MRATLIVLPFIVLTALSIWLFVETGSPRAIELVVRAVAPLTAIAFFPVVRGWRAQTIYEAVGAVPAPTGTAPVTKSALADASLAAGLVQPAELYLFTSEALNAFVWRSAGRERIAVSTGFSALPEAEQRAGIAMLFGRLRVDITAFAAEHELGEGSRRRRVAPEDDPVLFRAWVDAAVAGDREALEMLLEPVPMICLLERLSTSSRAVPEFARNAAQHDACFNFLAWPYGRWWHAKPDEDADSALPPEAEAAVAAVIAQEAATDATFSGSAAVRLGDAEALRAQQLRDVSGAEGAIAGSTSAVAAVDAQATAAQEPPEAAAAAAVPGEQAAPAPEVHAAGVSASNPDPGPTPFVQAAPVAATVGAAPAIAVSVPRAPDAGGLARPVRIDVLCPHCGADNAPTNRDCIVCGARLSPVH